MSFRRSGVPAETVRPGFRQVEATEALSPPLAVFGRDRGRVGAFEGHEALRHQVGGKAE